MTYGGFIRIEGKPTGAVIARMNPAESFRGWDLYLEDGKPASHVIDSWDKAANKIVAAKPLKPGEWHHVMVTFDGTISGHQASAIYVDGKKAEVENRSEHRRRQHRDRRAAAPRLAPRRRLETQRQGRPPGFPFLPPPACRR